MLVQANAQTPVQLSMPRHFVLAGASSPSPRFGAS